MKLKKKRSVKPYAPEELAVWTTERLLSLRNRLLRCEQCLEDSDWAPDEVDSTRISFKDDPRWSALYEAVLVLLRTREHVDRGGSYRPSKRTT